MKLNEMTPLDLVEQLRSGDYVKGKRVLKKMLPSNILNYCCLGVACEIASDVTFVRWPTEHAHSENYLKAVFGDEVINDGPKFWSSTLLPYEFMPAWMKLPARIGDTHFVVHDLIRLNDDHDTWEPIISFLLELQTELDNGL